MRERAEKMVVMGGSFEASGTPVADDVRPLGAAIEGIGRHCEGKEPTTGLKKPGRSLTVAIGFAGERGGERRPQ
jgi:hypothetical protein